jgi:glycosyltransferase involved in cell wall biosynthesis
VTAAHPTTPWPITVIFPCRDNLAEWPQHLESCAAWLPQVAQVVVVDSSSDDSIAYLKENLHHPNRAIFSHPPGLYQAWNAAVSAAEGKWIYYSTMGDEITTAELGRLLSLAEETDADVVVSPPRMQTGNGEASPERWPVHHLAEHLKKAGLSHMEFPPDLLGLLSAALAPKSVLGSSASNLYRRTTLACLPWPENLGHGGDAGWLCRNFQAIRLVLNSETTGTFKLNYQHRHGTNAVEAGLAHRLRAEALAGAEQMESSPLLHGGIQAVDAWQKILWDWLIREGEAATAAAEQRQYIACLEAEIEKLQRTPLNRLSRLLSGGGAPLRQKSQS